MNARQKARETMEDDTLKTAETWTEVTTESIDIAAPGNFIYIERLEDQEKKNEEKIEENLIVEGTKMLEDEIEKLGEENNVSVKQRVQTLEEKIGAQRTKQKKQQLRNKKGHNQNYFFEKIKTLEDEIRKLREENDVLKQEAQTLRGKVDEQQKEQKKQHAVFLGQQGRPFISLLFMKIINTFASSFCIPEVCSLCLNRKTTNVLLTPEVIQFCKFAILPQEGSNGVGEFPRPGWTSNGQLLAQPTDQFMN